MFTLEKMVVLKEIGRFVIGEGLERHTSPGVEVTQGHDLANVLTIHQKLTLQANLAGLLANNALRKESKFMYS